ncbi:MAG: orotidine-5'-phosphate decarboxylase [Bacteroidetes bacterium]|nr:orotidine-5'-phosphate decarboxylase [Bacteroidota bacterium]MDA0875449.1 orotidine-5'-phosphate decarboxylase [Bacteroidota bacterium]
MKPSFSDRLASLRSARHSVLCVGLDPDLERIPASLRSSLTPEEAVSRFCRAIVEATADLAVAFKINFAFFEALGARGTDVMQEVLDVIPADVLTVADAKRGDIGNSATFYARSVFEGLGYDSITVSPYMGRDSVDPFMDRPGTCAFVLARTSNPGGKDFQQLILDGRPLYEHVAQQVAEWENESAGEAGLVVGATDPEDMRRLRDLLPSTPFLIPGVGAQGGSAEAVMRAAGAGPVLINSSRAILYASGGSNFAEAARRAAMATREELGA